MSLRELLWKVEYVTDERWEHTSAMLWIQAQTAFGNKRKWKPEDFHPRRKKRRRRMTKEETVNAVTEAFSGGKPKVD